MAVTKIILTEDYTQLIFESGDLTPDAPRATLWAWGCRCWVTGATDEDVTAAKAGRGGAWMPSDAAMKRYEETGQLSLPGGRTIDARSPRRKAQETGKDPDEEWWWNPGDLRIPVESLKARYQGDPVTWAAFESWAKRETIGEGADGTIRIWDWMHGAPAEAHKERLTETQRRAFELYTSTEYRKWNRKLRSGEPLGEDEAMIGAMSAALKSAPKYRGTVFRRASFGGREEAERFLGDLPEGAKTKFAGFTSTATETDRTRTFSGDFNVDMEIESRSGVYLGGMSVLTREREVLFDRGTSFIVRKVERVADTV